MSVESDITQLQADVLALQGTLESIRQSLQDQIDALTKRVRTLEEDLAWRQKERG